MQVHNQVTSVKVTFQYKQDQLNNTQDKHTSSVKCQGSNAATLRASWLQPRQDNKGTHN